MSKVCESCSFNFVSRIKEGVRAANVQDKVWRLTGNSMCMYSIWSKHRMTGGGGKENRIPQPLHSSRLSNKHVGPLGITTINISLICDQHMLFILFTSRRSLWCICLREISPDPFYHCNLGSSTVFWYYWTEHVSMKMSFSEVKFKLLFISAQIRKKHLITGPAMCVYYFLIVGTFVQT